MAYLAGHFRLPVGPCRQGEAISVVDGRPAAGLRYSLTPSQSEGGDQRAAVHAVVLCGQAQADPSVAGVCLPHEASLEQIRQCGNGKCDALGRVEGAADETVIEENLAKSPMHARIGGNRRVPKVVEGILRGETGYIEDGASQGLDRATVVES